MYNNHELFRVYSPSDLSFGFFCYTNPDFLGKKVIMNNKKTNKVRYMTVTAMLSAVAFVLMYLEFPIPIMPSFIKFDFSDLPALIGSFAMGPLCGVLVELIKNLLHSVVSQSFGIGEISNFLLGAVFVAVAGLIYKHKKSRKNALIGSLLGAFAMAAASFPINYFIVYPIYYQFMSEETVLAMYQAIMPSVSSIATALLIFNVPFTFIKGLISVAITFLVYKKLSPILKGQQ